MSIVLDTLEYANELKAAGFTDKQAEVQARALARIVDEKLATKQDVKELEANLKSYIIRWVAGMLVAQAALIAALVKLT
ncbi:MAG: DUF1640 domain-containing protein [Nitrospinae bacterium]|nr:DUF1640 domain-containing protein [Nitrospinota bacterium]